MTTFQVPVEFYVTVDDGKVTGFTVSPLESAAYHFGGSSFEVERGQLDPEVHLWPAVKERLADGPTIEVNWEE